MAALFGILTLLCLLFFVIGIFSPKISLFFMAPEKRARGKSALIYFVGFIVTSLICASFAPSKEEIEQREQATAQQRAEEQKLEEQKKAEEQKLQEQKKAEAEAKAKEEQEKKAAEERAQKLNAFNEKYKDFVLGQYNVNVHHPKFVEEFIEVNPELSKDDKDKFRKCLSEYAYTKDKNLKAIEAIGWCKNEKLNNPEAFEDHIDLDKLFTQFSPWDGSFRPLEAFIKENMNDPKSYDHANTYYRLQLNDRKNPKAIITEEFRGKNAFGAVVKQIVQIEYDINKETFRVIGQ